MEVGWIGYSENVANACRLALDVQVLQAGNYPCLLWHIHRVRPSRAVIPDMVIFNKDDDFAKSSRISWELTITAGEQEVTKK